MAGNETIRGYRILGDRKPERQLSMDYLVQSSDAAKAQRELWKEALDNDAPCVVGDGDKWIPDELPTDREAQMMCATCPLAAFAACKVYAETAHPAWGVYAGKVYGRKLQAAMKEGGNSGTT